MRYRIVRDRWLGYEVQIKPWWSPVWFQKGFSNTFSTIEKARAFALADDHPVEQGNTSDSGHE